MTLAEAQAEILSNASFDLYLKEGESPTPAQIVTLINRARRIINKRRHLYKPFVPLALTAGQDTYGFESGAFGNRIVTPYGGWLNWRKVRDDQGDYGLWDRDQFERSHPTWPFRPPASSQLMVRMDKSLVVWPAPTQEFIDRAKAASSGRKVIYRINLYSANASTYKLTLNTQETSALGPSASVASITSALVALSNVVAGDLYVTLVDGVRHIYDVSYVQGELLGSDIDLSITSNTLTGGTATATCTPMGAFVSAQVIENDMTVTVEDSVEMPEPIALHYGITDLAVILSAKWMANEDEAWRRLTAINSGAVDLIEEEARESRQAFRSMRNVDARRVHRG